MKHETERNWIEMDAERSRKTDRDVLLETTVLRLDMAKSWLQLQSLNATCHVGRGWGQELCLMEGELALDCKMLEAWHVSWPRSYSAIFVPRSPSSSQSNFLFFFWQVPFTLARKPFHLLFYLLRIFFARKLNFLLRNLHSDSGWNVTHPGTLASHPPQ